MTCTSADRVRDVIHNFNADGFDALYPKYRGGRPKTFTLPERREIKKITKSKPAEHGLPFSAWRRSSTGTISRTSSTRCRSGGTTCRRPTGSWCRRPTRGARFLEFCRYPRRLYPPEIRIAIVCDNFSPHLTSKKDTRVGDWAAANNVEFAYTPTNSSWLNASRPSSPPCVTSHSTAPTTPATRSRAA